MPLCETHDEFMCSWGQILPSFNRCMKKYQKTCTVLQFSGDVEWDDFVKNDTGHSLRSLTWIKVIKFVQYLNIICENFNFLKNEPKKKLFVF